MSRVIYSAKALSYDELGLGLAAFAATNSVPAVVLAISADLARRLLSHLPISNTFHCPTTQRSI
jgi:Ca2+/Na+ antiporter